MARGEISIEEAEQYFKNQPIEDIGYAQLDIHREIRSGFPEVVFCSGKADAHLEEIFVKLYEKNGCVLGTRASEEQYEIVKRRLPDISYDSISKIIKIQQEHMETIVRIAVCCAGTADIPVAEEAAQTAEFFGGNVDRIYDIGVSGIHRVFNKLDIIRQANCIIVVAGMEGALASVLGGLVSKPIIAVPTAVGYGANLGGLSAFLTLIHSCAKRITVVF